MKERHNLPVENTYLIVLFKHSLFLLTGKTVLNTGKN
jgi:hypothetical protein